MINNRALQKKNNFIHTKSLRCLWSELLINLYLDLAMPLRRRSTPPRHVLFPPLFESISPPRLIWCSENTWGGEHIFRNNLTWCATQINEHSCLTACRALKKMSDSTTAYMVANSARKKLNVLCQKWDVYSPRGISSITFVLALHICMPYACYIRAWVTTHWLFI